jgi:dTDP-4-amino-4,6-dideoxygalactose transaminase
MKKNKNAKLDIPFNLPSVKQGELSNIRKAHKRGQLSGDGYYTKKCHEWIENYTGTKKAFLTHSCTGALEMMTMLAGIGPGDEVIMPSFNFTSSANAVVLRGGVPVFVDIRPDTLNIDEKRVEEAITPKTKAIFVVHYAGVACEMDTLKKIAKKHNLLILEDAAQGILSKYKGQFLGTIGDMGAYSFHETKNVISGEGGCLLINDKKYIEKAEIIREKGTNRSQFFRGQVDKYTWVDIGSSYLPGELVAAFLYAQLQRSEKINKKRIKIWDYYYDSLTLLKKKGFLKLPVIPKKVEHNGHLFYIVVENTDTRQRLMKFLESKGIHTTFHYVPLHSSLAGLKYGRYVGNMQFTDHYSQRLLRLPLFYDMTRSKVKNVVKEIETFYEKNV